MGWPRNKNEFLDESDFDQDVAGADGEESRAERRFHRALLRQLRAEQDGRKQEDYRYRGDADEQQFEEQRDRFVDFEVGVLFGCALEEGPEVAGLDSVEEERLIIRDRSDVEGVVVFVNLRGPD